LAAPERKFEPIIVFVHQYGGRKESVRAHQKFVGELGFDSVAFDLSLRDLRAILHRLPLTHHFKLGIVPLWTEEIHQVLSALPGPKILYSFSFPSVAALAVIKDRGAKDVIAWVCDGGPFLQPWRVFWNYLAVMSKITNPVLRASLSTLAYVLFQGQNVANDVHSNFKLVARNFPILSIRYWQDQMVPMPAVDEAFMGSEQTALEVLSLPEGDHIQGLLESPQEYKPRVSQFLRHVANSKENP
jgi:hypothetical protein